VHFLVKTTLDFIKMHGGTTIKKHHLTFHKHYKCALMLNINIK